MAGATYITHVKSDAGWFPLRSTRHHDRAESRRLAEALTLFSAGVQMTTVLDTFSSVPACPCPDCKATAESIMESFLHPQGWMPERAPAPEQEDIAA